MYGDESEASNCKSNKCDVSFDFDLGKEASARNIRPTESYVDA